MANNPQVIDKSIMFSGGADKYGAVMFEPKEIVTKPDTSKYCCRLEKPKKNGVSDS